jgi:hypothetical protein
MNDDKPASAAPDASLAGNTGDSSKGHVAAQVDRVSQRAAESASDKPAPHDTPHEVAGSPVRNPDDLEGDGSPGTSNEATKQLPP